MSTEGDKVISPLTLDHAWPEVTRLLSLWILTTFTLMFNGFFTASFFIDSGLQRRGMLFLACVGVADLLVTGIVFPTASVVMLSRIWDTKEVCYFLHFIVAASTYAYSLFFALSSAETYFRLCRPLAEYRRFLEMRLCTISVAVFAVCFATAGVGVFFGLNYDCCRRAHHGDFYFMIVTDIIFHGIPGLFSVVSQVCSLFAIRRRARALGHYRRCMQFDIDKCFNILNICSFLFFSGFWMPYLVTVYVYPEVPDQPFYYFLWIGNIRTVFTSPLFGTFDPTFRRAFATLFCYCFCQSTPYFTSRRRRNNEMMCLAMDARDVRVHILQEALISNSPRRLAASFQETEDV